MRFSLVSAALLSFIWMSVVHATAGPVSRCCMQWSKTRVPLGLIQSYTNQSEGVCPVKAILFRTKKGKTICSDPSSDWARRAILKVDEEGKKKALQENGQNEDGSTSDITPAVVTTSKNARRVRGKRVKKCQKNKCRRGRGKKGQRSH